VLPGSEKLESVPRVLEKISAEDLYAETGVPPAAINTIFQLEAESVENPKLLGRTRRLLMIADYIHFRPLRSSRCGSVPGQHEPAL
jgi:rhamnulokinase